ncbi:MAG: sugar transporter [Mogibacterium sp.]|nr:sugar transporter [Mogibacterium sp.]
MSITAETAAAHANDPAVLCCRAEAGTKLGPENFEDPAIFPDLIDTGLLNVDGALKLGQVLNGSTLTKTVDSLTPITPDIVDRYDEEGGAEAEEAEAEVVEAAPAVPEVGGAVSGVTMHASGGVLKLYIGEGKDIAIEFPL